MKTQGKAAHAAFIESATALMVRALRDRLALRIELTSTGEGVAELFDEHGRAELTHQLACPKSAQLSLPIASPAARPAPAAPTPCVHTWERIEGEHEECWYECVWCDAEKRRGQQGFAEVDARHLRNTQRGEATKTTRVWIPESEWDALDGGMQGYLAAIDVPDHGNAAIEWRGSVGFVWADVAEGVIAEELRATLRNEEITFFEGIEAPKLEEPTVEEKPVEAPASKPRKRAKKAASTKADEGAISGAKLKKGPGGSLSWLVVDMDGKPGALIDLRGISADGIRAAVASRSGDPACVRIVGYHVPIAHKDGDVAETVVTWERQPTAPAESTEAPRAEVVVTTVDVAGLRDGRDFSAVPEHVRDLAPLAEPGWCCVVAQDATRPGETQASLCPDLDTARSKRDQLIKDDKGANSLDRIALFNGEGEFLSGESWFRHAPTSEALAQHPEARLFRISTPTPDALVAAHEWALNAGLCWYGATYQRLSPAEIAEGEVWLRWMRQNSEAVVIVPRELVLFVERRASEVLASGRKRAELRIEPWTSSDDHQALRVGSVVSVGDVDWRVFLMDLHDITLTCDPEEIAVCSTEDLMPSGASGRWWCSGKVRKPKAQKTMKRAKGGAS